MKKDWQIENKFFCAYSASGTFELKFNEAQYFDPRPSVSIGLYWILIHLYLPFKSKWTDEPDPPSWGIAIHNKRLWLYYGGKGDFVGNRTRSWGIPFIDYIWVRTSILLSDDTWGHERPGDRKIFYDEAFVGKKKSFQYKYTDKYDGAIVDATVTVEEREWRPKWLTWTKLFAKVNRTIAVEFSEQVGSRKGSWKGGTLGCGWSMLPGETPLECVKRMEAEREF